MARYPSGITPMAGADVEDLRVRLARMQLEMDEHPISATAPCANPECTRPVDFLGEGPPPLYCSTTCRTRATTLRALIRDQVDLLERTLAESRGRHDVPRDDLRHRVRMLHWWLMRLGTREDREQSV